MNIKDLLNVKLIKTNLNSNTKEEVINELISLFNENGYLSDKEKFKESILAREKQSTTGIGDGIAIPHAKTSAVKIPAVAIGISKEGIDYNALDDKPSHIFLMIAASDGANEDHLSILSQLSVRLMDDNVRNSLMKASNEQEIMNIFTNDNESNEEGIKMSEKKKIVAVTACPTGIAHTFMAADKLKKTAEELGVEIKIETNGASGVENELTKEDIESAIGVIVAADKHVEMNRFKGKKVLEVAVADGIKKPKELIQKIVDGKANIYQANDEVKTEKSEEKRTGFYKHLMNGVSNMLPFVVGGGILIAICFMFGIKAFDPKDPSYNSIAEALMTIGGKNAFALMVPILAGFIAMSIADRPGFAAGMVGGMLASSGGAGFLGGIIAGFLAGYLVQGIKYLLKKLPKWLDGIKNVMLLPVLGIASTGFIMLFVVNKPVAFVNTHITEFLQGLSGTNAVFLGLLLGLMMAFDMGGPVNKAAYVFGTGLLVSGVTEPMAAVMAAGMTPPLGIALATKLFKNKFTKEEREMGISTAAMGISFITEGAIPFAAADPLRVIPSLMIGSGLTGALSMLFNIGLKAPHGGIFVLFIPNAVSNVFLYAIAILAGTVATAIMLGVLKKNVKK